MKISAPQSTDIQHMIFLALRKIFHILFGIFSADQYFETNLVEFSTNMQEIYFKLQNYRGKR